MLIAGCWLGPLACLLSAAAAAEKPAAKEASPGGAATPAPWTDPSLPVKSGLAVWLDVSRQTAARKAEGKMKLSDGLPVDVLLDGSGWKRDFAALTPQSRPTYIESPSGPIAVRFDGTKNVLTFVGNRPVFNDFTAVVVAVPRSSDGRFPALLSAWQGTKNDFRSGFNIDFGPRGSHGPTYNTINVEGPGFGGAGNLLARPGEWNVLHAFAVSSTSGPNGVKLFVDGRPGGSRDRKQSTIAADSLSLGARHFDNEGKPPEPSGFFEGDVCEVLLYDRALSAEEQTALAGYLTAKHAGAAKQLAEAPARADKYERLKDAPEVQMFVPGFTARSLPLQLTNINNLRYRDDGKLVALAYDGNVYLLTDTDGDGLEDKAELFWDNHDRIVSPIGMALTPPNYSRGRGLFVASKGKLSLIVDTDGDDKADKEIVVASGWPPIGHRVDALGVAVGADESIYFGLGTADFGNPYLLDEHNQPHYELKTDRSTIMRVSPDFSHRESICSGIRFPVGLAFNAAGDLFATDQEGATWLSNGNPFDELLYIQPGRHYGFPPQHPRFLPNVIDEPSTFDYAPQHQSTCGLCFNEPVNGGPVFGPEAWRGNAFVAGASRGKLYRTELSKTADGYVAQNHLVGSLTQLAIDVCISPRGDLLVSTHSGNPDWGSGPRGLGKLFKISYTEPARPQPTAIWASRPDELRVAFDRPLSSQDLAAVQQKPLLEFGKYVSAGDVFETIWPGYAAVQNQQKSPRERLAIRSMSLDDAGRTLVLKTDAQSEAVRYGLSIGGLNAGSLADASTKSAAATTSPPGPKGEPATQPAGAIVQKNRMELGYDLFGVSAEWRESAGSPAVAAWLPHPNLAVSRQFTQGSAAHDRLWSAIAGKGTLTLKTSLDLWQMLSPMVQPGSRLDHTPPAEIVTVTFSANVPLKLTSADTSAKIASTSPGGGTKGGAGDPHAEYAASITVSPRAGVPTPVELSLPTGTTGLSLSVSFGTQRDDKIRPLALRRFVVPWAKLPAPADPTQVLSKSPELAGGDWLAGREVFFSEQAACYKCHRVNGQGNDIGPDLSNLIHRDYDSVVRDIRNPSGALNPDYLSSTVTTKEGDVYFGIVREVDADHVIVRGDAAGEAMPIAKRDIEKMAPSDVSLMPNGIPEGLGKERMRNLLTFLLTPPLEPAPPERDGMPPPRTQQELSRLIAPAAAAPSPTTAAPRQPVTGGPATRPGEPAAGPASRPSQPAMKVLLVSGPKDHGPGEHDYPVFQKRWATLLGLADDVKVEKADRWPSAQQWGQSDVIVFYSANPDWNEAKGKELDAFLARGGGAVFLHFAINGQDVPESLASRIGLAWKPKASKFRHGDIELTFTDPTHPITQGFQSPLKLTDESYWELVGDPSQVHLLATANEAGAARPMLWTIEPAEPKAGDAKAGGRIFVCIPGHFTWTFDDPLYRLLLLRGICWAGRQPTDRLDGLVTLGARVAE